MLAPSPQNEATFPRWLVVDGQQRLTTLSLALAAIREHIAGAQPDEAECIDEERAERFFHQLTADDSPETVEAVRDVFAHWEELGGWIGHGSGRVTTSAFLMLGNAGSPGRGIWPLTLYPGSGRGGTAEVVFQHLAGREPFTDRALRSELLRRLNEMDGVDIPEGRLDLRPNIRLSLLEKDANRERLFEALAWFRDRWEARDPS